MMIARAKFNVDLYSSFIQETDGTPPAGWPRGIPPGGHLLGRADWSFSPASGRSDIYKGWTSRRQARTFLWMKSLDAAEIGIFPGYRAYACGPLADLDERESLVRCLAAAWYYERLSEWELDKPHRITAEWFTKIDFEKATDLAWAEAVEADESSTDVSPAQSEANKWAARATWVVGRWNGAGGMYHAFNMGLRQAAARYVAQHRLKATGRLPEGDVSVELTYAPDGTGDLRTPFGTSTGTLRCVLTFPTHDMINKPRKAGSSESDPQE